jgi:SprT protein
MKQATQEQIAKRIDNTLILPLSAEKQQLIIDETQAYIKQARRLFSIKNSAFSRTVDITFNLKGRASGMYRVKRSLLHRSREIRYNPYIFSKYFDDNLNTTVPHEVAHYISDLIYGLQNIKPHGKEWQQIMYAFGADASVTANYDLTGIPQNKSRSVTYQCNCGDRQLSLIRHNKIIYRRYKYYCKTCKQTLQQKESAVV